MRTEKLLKEILERNGVSQKWISQEAGISPAAISRMLNGDIGFKKETLESILKKIQLSKEVEFEIWKAWTLDRGEEGAARYFEKLDKENKKLKKILSSIKEL